VQTLELKPTTLPVETVQCQQFTACQAMMKDMLGKRTEIKAFSCPNIPNYDCDNDDCDDGNDCQAE
jgi:hypothetical protein